MGLSPEEVYMSKYEEIDLTNVSTYSVEERPSKVSVDDFSSDEMISTQDFIDALPDILAAKDLKDFIAHIKNALENNKPVILMFGGHVIKCGLSPIINQAIEQGIISAIAVNGSVAIHDFEIAFFGKTSEDVRTALEDGSFGMGAETGRIINEVISEGFENDLGFGEALGKFILEERPPYHEYSVFAKAYEHNVPMTVHVAIGTDIIHQHPQADGAAIGGCSYTDFKIFTNMVKELDNGGVLISFGSAVILPEVFLKALTIVRNLQYTVNNFFTGVFDMNRHYRPLTNIVNRPTAAGGRGYYFIGHHEIMLPLLFGSLLEE